MSKQYRIRRYIDKLRPGQVIDAKDVRDDILESLLRTGAAVEVTAVTVERTAEVKTELSDLTVTELKEMAKAQGITGYSSLNKADLIEALS